MPRVNRDLQRRLEARRERARTTRRAERRYTFTPTPSAEPVSEQRAVEPSTAHENGTAATPVRESRAATSSFRVTPRRRAPRPFSEYRAEYAYVYGDLKRIALVVGVILVLLTVLWLFLR